MTTPGTPNTANAYLQTKVMSATPEELRLMLIDGAIKFATQGRDGLVNEDHEQAFAGFSQARPIILELLNTIRPDPDPELAERVRSLYTFLFSELVQSAYDRDVPRVEKVIELLTYERETWVMLMEKLASDRGTGQVPPAAAESANEPKSHSAFSVQG